MKLNLLIPTLLFTFFVQNQIVAQNNIQLTNTLLTARTVVSDLDIPWEIVWGPDDYIWVTERKGIIWRINPTTGAKTEVLNIESKIADNGNGEPGLLGMVIHPNFVDTPKVYFVYNYNQAGDIDERLVSCDWNGTQLVNETTLLDNVPGGNIHNGSRLIITDDRKILFSTGDTGSGSLSQQMSSINGKILRINLDGTIPSDNPFPGSLVYSFGHRNPQGLCFGPNGLIYSSEHGAQQSDEFNLIEVGRNYGWPNVQGACNTTTEITFCTNNNVREPLMEWTPCVAVNGIEYYNHPAVPEFQNCVLMAVLGGFVQQPRLSVLQMSSNGLQITSENQYITNLGRIRDICVNPHNGAIYICNNGPSYPGSGPNSLIEYRNLAYQPTGIHEINSPLISKISNPISKNQALDLHFSTLQSGTFEILTIEGKVIHSDILKERVQIQPQIFSNAGIYILKVHTGNAVFNQKIMVN